MENNISDADDLTNETTLKALAFLSSLAAIVSAFILMASFVCSNSSSVPYVGIVLMTMGFAGLAGRGVIWVEGATEKNSSAVRILVASFIIGLALALFCGLFFVEKTCGYSIVDWVINHA